MMGLYIAGACRKSAIKAKDVILKGYLVTRHQVAPSGFATDLQQIYIDLWGKMIIFGGKVLTVQTNCNVDDANNSRSLRR